MERAEVVEDFSGPCGLEYEKKLKANEEGILINLDSAGKIIRLVKDRVQLIL